jgi:PEP-CTERM motif
VAGTTYRISLDGLADNFSAGPLGDDAGTMNGSFTWQITSGAGAIPEPSAWAMLVVGFAGLGLVGRRRAAQTLAVRA